MCLTSSLTVYTKVVFCFSIIRPLELKIGIHYHFLHTKCIFLVLVNTDTQTKTSSLLRIKQSGVPWKILSNICQD